MSERREAENVGPLHLRGLKERAIEGPAIGHEVRDHRPSHQQVHRGGWREALRGKDKIDDQERNEKDRPGGTDDLQFVANVEFIANLKK